MVIFYNNRCLLFSTAVWATAVLMQSVGGEQKLQTADFPCTPPHSPLVASWAEGYQKIQGWFKGPSDIWRCTPPP